MSCKKYATLTKGLAPDPKGQLNTLLVVTLPHILDCSSRRRNFPSIVLLQTMGDGIGSMWLIYIRVYMERQGVVIIFFLFFLYEL